MEATAIGVALCSCSSVAFTDRGDDLVKPTRVAGSSIKGHCISKEIGFFLGDKDPLGPSFVFGGTRNRSHVLSHIVTT
ncbi:Uncharacterized protein FWK35_00013727 [Aphis craccivora]|uniref:Uncharacterized protein n=1 Tax=Aphis craccivora TaxID=307492 RepID=A0A6G0YGE9_APHCR|nr:Uncharacterized protein FWK35_00013727 [Aphis craccivora]